MTDTQDLSTLYLTADITDKPETNKNHLRLYGHHLCPFVEKARLALAARGVQYQNVELDLNNKRPWHVAANGGTVPLIETTDGTIIIESKIVMEYAQEAYETGYSTLPSDPVQKALVRVAINLVEALIPPFYSIYFKKGKVTDEDVEKIREKLQKIEDFYEKNAGESAFAFGTENPTQFDIHVFPYANRLDSLNGSVFHDIYEKLRFNEFPRINKLVEAIRAREEFRQAITQKFPIQVSFETLSKLEEGQRMTLSLPVRFE